MAEISKHYIQSESSSIVYTGNLNETKVEIKEEENDGEICDTVDNSDVEIKDEPLDRFIDAGSKYKNEMCKSIINDFPTNKYYINYEHPGRVQNGQDILKNTSQDKLLSTINHPLENLIRHDGNNYNINQSGGYFLSYTDNIYLYSKSQSTPMLPNSPAADTKSICKTSVQLLQENILFEKSHTNSAEPFTQGQYKTKIAITRGAGGDSGAKIPICSNIPAAPGTVTCEKMFKGAKEKLALHLLQELNYTKPTFQLHKGQVEIQESILQPTLQFSQTRLPQDNINLNTLKPKSLMKVSHGMNTNSLELQKEQVLLQWSKPQPAFQLSQGQLLYEDILSTESENQSTLQQGKMVLQEPKPQPTLQLSQGHYNQEPSAQSIIQYHKDQLLFLPEGGKLFMFNKGTNVYTIVQLKTGLVLLPPHNPNTHLTLQVPQGQFYFPQQNSPSIPNLPREQSLIQQPQSILTPLDNDLSIQQRNVQSTSKLITQMLPQVPNEQKTEDFPIRKQARDAKRALEKQAEESEINFKKLNNTIHSEFKQVIPNEKTILEIQDLLKTTEAIVDGSCINDPFIFTHIGSYTPLPFNSEFELHEKLKQSRNSDINSETVTDSEIENNTKTLPVYFDSDDYINDRQNGRNSIISFKHNLNKEDMIRGAKMVHQHITYFNNDVEKLITDQELYQHMKSKYTISNVQHCVGEKRFSSYQQFCRDPAKAI